MVLVKMAISPCAGACERLPTHPVPASRRHSGSGRDARLTRTDYQLCFTQHLAASVTGQACVDTRIVLGHVPQHQGVGGPVLLLAQPGAVHQLGIVLEA